MAKVTFSSDIESISGKLCKNEGTVYSVNRRTGKTYRSHRHGYTDANTPEQQANRAEFKTKSQFAAQWWNANKPTATVPDDSSSVNKGTEAYQAVMKAYKAQTKIGNPYSFLRSLVTDDLKIMLGTRDLTGTPDPGGDDTPGGGSGTGGGEVEG